MRRINARGVEEMYFWGVQNTVDTLRDMEGLPCHTYIQRYIPQPTDIDFHISQVSHVTTKSGLEGILDSGGFKGGARSLLWWSLAIEEDDIATAESRFLETIFPNRTPEQRQTQEPFLNKFTSSPAFRRQSRYGNFRLTAGLPDLLQAYREQFCGGGEPVLRVYGTTVYKQEVMYTVLVHSPGVKEFDTLPLLDGGGGDDTAVFMYNKDAGNIVWRAQAVSGVHEFQPVVSSPGVIAVEPFDCLYECDSWYVWDHVTVAFVVPEGGTLRMDRERLVQSLSACEADDPFLGVRCVPYSYNCTCTRCRLSLSEAQHVVEQIREERGQPRMDWSEY